MTQTLPDGVIIYGKELDLVYSPDEHGWYWQKFPKQTTSRLYASKQEALKARADNKIEWDE